VGVIVIVVLKKIHNCEMNYLNFSTKHYWDDVVIETGVDR
jgi:hypothetical protein